LESYVANRYIFGGKSMSKCMLKITIELYKKWLKQLLNYGINNIKNQNVLKFSHKIILKIGYFDNVKLLNSHW